MEEVTDNDNESGESLTNEADEKDSQESTNIATETEESEEQDKVYWTESGGVWHLSKDCGHLKKSKNIISGTEEEAKAAGKSKVCSSCEKKAN